MSTRPFATNSNLLETTGLAISAAVAFAFGALVFVTPWMFGGVETWYRAVISGVLVVLAALTALASLLTRPAFRVRGMLVILAPLALLLAIGAAQWAGGLFSVGEVGEWGEIEEWSARTIYPGATELACAGLLAALAAAFIGAAIFSRDEMFVGLLMTCLLAATAVGFFGIGMRLSGDDRMIRGVAVVGTPFANFVNRNNAAAFLLLGVGCGIALLASLMRDRHSPENVVLRVARRFGFDRQTLVIVVLTLTAIPLAGIVASASRGGTISAAITVLAGVALLGKTGRWRWALLLVPALVLAAALVTWLGLSETTISRFESLTWREVFSTGRVPHWIDATHAMRARPVFGAGLGTYGYAYQAHSQRETDGWFQHADNEFVELAVELGAAGVLSLAAGLAILTWAIVRGRDRPMERTLVVCVVAGALTHAIFDYGLVIPATSLPAAALVAAAALRLISADIVTTSRWMRWLRRASLAGMALLLAGGLTWAAAAQRDAWVIDKHRIDGKLTRSAGAFEPGELDQRIGELSEALASRPQDAEGQRLLAELYAYRYRISLSEQLREASSSLSEAQAWDTTSMISLHRAINRIADASYLPNLTRMRQDPAVRRDLAPARARYEAAAAACPSLIGIRVPLQGTTFLDPELDLRDTSQAVIAARRFPADADLMRTMAKMAWASHDQKVAGMCWRNAFRVSGDGLAGCLDQVHEELDAPRAVALIWPERTVALGELAIAAAGMRESELRHAVGVRLLEMAKQGKLGENLRVGKAYGQWLVGNERIATQSFEEILAESPLNTDLRVDFAQLLWSSGNLDLALDELKQAIWLDPGRSDLRVLMARWAAHQKSVERGR